MVEYLRGRGLEVTAVRPSFVKATAGSMVLAFWCPHNEFPHFDDVEDARRELELDSVDALVVVSYRPYVVVDYLGGLLERAARWYGIKLQVKLIGASSVELYTALEEALGKAFVDRPKKLGPGRPLEERCPQCLGGTLTLHRLDRHYSYRFGMDVLESIISCSACSLRLRRIDLLN